MVEAFQPWIEMGEQRGLLQGRQEGRQETLQQLALKLLQHRFGVLAADMHAHILALPSQRLEALSEALLDFASLEDLSRWLSANPAPVSSVN